MEKAGPVPTFKPAMEQRDPPVAQTGDVLRAMRSILRPLARVAVARALPLSGLVQVLKAVLVEAAATELAARGEKPTQSRLSVLTGVHRRDVRMLMGANPRDGHPHEPVSRTETVIGRWLGDRRYRDPQGRPLPLPRFGPAPSFEALAEAVSKDVRPRTILDELKRLGCVRHDEDADVVHLDVAAFIPTADETAMLAMFEANLADHANAAAGNLRGQGPFLERAVYYTHVPTEAVDALERQARVASRVLLEALNADALAAQRQADAADGARLERFRFGVFFYREAMAESADENTADETARRTEEQS